MPPPRKARGHFFTKNYSKNSQMNEYKRKIREAAIAYVMRGWKVVPLHSVTEDGYCTCGSKTCTDIGKHPVKSLAEKGLKSATRDLSIVERWFADDSQECNIGVITGEESGITVIDIDIGDGKFGAESWQEIVDEHGEVATLTATTGSGGVHLVFLYNSALKTAANVLGKGIDCRNDGGYIVASPSKHRSGGVYSWVDEDAVIAPLPAHLSRRKETRGRPRKGDITRAKYTLTAVIEMLQVVPADNRDVWRNVGIILGREFNRSDEAWQAYNSWADKWLDEGGKKGRNHDKIMEEAFYQLSAQDSGNSLSIATIVKLAQDNGWAPKQGDIPVEHFVYYAPNNDYIYRPTGMGWVGSAVDAGVSPVNEQGKIIAASEWLKMNMLASSMTIDPSIDDDYIKGYDNRNGEVYKVVGGALYNSYRKPTIEHGDPRLAQPFVEHCERLFNKPGDADQFINYMAHRVQRPWEKPRFALMIAGMQGVGKDTAIEFCQPAIGTWNVANIDPSAFDQGFNEFAAKTLVRISEAANLHEMSKWAFNERTKVLIAGSPDVMEINPKYGKKYSIKMFCGVIITTNHLASGIYIPPDDRRYDVIETATMDEAGLSDPDERRAYFESLWDWFLRGGDTHVAAYLASRDLSKFSASNGQRKTEAHRTVIAVGMMSDDWLTNIIDDLEKAAEAHNMQLVAVRGDDIVNKAISAGEKIGDVKRKIGATLGRFGFSLYRCPSRSDGRWNLGGKRTNVYIRPEAGDKFDPTNCPLLQESW